MIDAICPKCGKKHRASLRDKERRVEWTGGDITPRIVCTPCKHTARFLEVSAQDKKDIIKKPPIKLNGYRERGIEHDLKQKMDITLELLGRKFRARYAA